MAWHEWLAWIIILLALIATAIWVVKLILCPKSKCEGCNKQCLLKRSGEKN